MIKIKKLMKASFNMTKTGVILGAGATAVTRAGGNAAGLNTLGSYMPTTATVKGAGLTLGMVAKLKPKRRY